MPAALILTLDAAGEGCRAALVDADTVRAERTHAGFHGSAAILPHLVDELLKGEGVPASALEAVAVTVGPGSFTGVRAALSLAHGIAAAAGIPVRGVTVGEAIRAAHLTPGRTLWVATDSRRERVFLERGPPDDVVAVNLADVPAPDGPVTVAGSAAPPVVARLREMTADVEALGIDGPGPRGIARAARLRPDRPAVPLYVDPPEARPGPPARPMPA